MLERPQEETERILGEAAAKHEACLVAFSGGKDSLVVLDLCWRTFRRVEAFCMVLVPGLRCLEEQLEFARERWGVTIHEYPHWLLSKYVAQGTYGWGRGSADAQAAWSAEHELKQKDVYALASKESGIRIVASGQRKADYLFRVSDSNRGRRRASFELLLPIVGWNKLDVLAYLKTHDIPLPDTTAGKSTTGIDLSTPSLLFLHDRYPDDFERLCEFFPFAKAAVCRREWFGVG